MNYLKQIWYELREQPLVTWVSISGTALSLFLVMAVFMVNRAGTAAKAPESNRERIYKAPYIHAENQNGNGGSASLSPDMAAKLYEGLPGVERISYYSTWDEPATVSMPGTDMMNFQTKKVDHEFWNIFDFNFLSGEPFTKAEVEAGINEVIISESVARELGGDRNLTGREIMINYYPYTIKGVVSDPHPLLHNTWAQIWIAWREGETERWMPEMGQTGVFLLLEPSASGEEIKKEVEHRYQLYNASIAKEGKQLIYHNSPFSPEEQNMAFGSNSTPDVEGSKHRRWLLYLIVLLLPAINLSGMTRSRLRRRISEIGVRRAYGATRFRVIIQLISENLFLTLAGGLIGLILCFIFIAEFSNLFVDYVSKWNTTDIEASARPAFEMMFTWGAFGFALLFCFILNLISTGLPAFKATAVNPAEAISAKNH